MSVPPTPPVEPIPLVELVETPPVQPIPPATFEEFGAEQTLAIAQLATFRGRRPVFGELAGLPGWSP